MNALYVTRQTPFQMAGIIRDVFDPERLIPLLLLVLIVAWIVATVGRKK